MIFNQFQWNQLKVMAGFLTVNGIDDMAGITDLPSQAKTQYLQIWNIVDTSIKHPITGQSTTVVKGSMYIWFIW